jgi:hypothetical protein
VGAKSQWRREAAKASARPGDGQRAPELSRRLSIPCKTDGVSRAGCCRLAGRSADWIGLFSTPDDESSEREGLNSVAGPFTNARQLSSHSTNTSRPRPRSLALHPPHIAHLLAAFHCTSPHRDSRLTLSLQVISLPALLRRAGITAQFDHHARSTSVLRNTRPPASL